MRKLRNRFDRFCLRHRNKGIPNLMLYLTIGSAIVYFFDMTAGDGGLGQLLSFNYWQICQGQVWRLFTFALVPLYENPFLTLISLYCTYSLGRAVESSRPVRPGEQISPLPLRQDKSLR